jgi:predicted ArsR family transcriptional regulator
MMSDEAALSAAALLGDGVRRSICGFVRAQAGPVTREEAARALRISVKLAAFHMDKLVDGGLLRAEQGVPTGIRRRVGRAPKRYSPSEIELSLLLPERRYDLMCEILLEALGAETGLASGPARSASEAALAVARQRGLELGARARAARGLGRPGPERTLAAAQGILDEVGYETLEEDCGGLVLRNCPFHPVVQRAPELVCAINAAFVEGVLRGLGNDTVRATLEPEEGRCCVLVRPPRARKT